MKKTLKEKIILGVVSGIFTIYSITLIFPFLWMFINSLKTNWEFLLDIWGLPTNWNFGIFIDALNYTYKGNSTLDMFLNSIFYVVFNVGINIVVNVATAYVLAKLKFKGSELLNAIILILMVIPLTGSTVTVYRFMKNLNLYNTFPGLIILTTGGLGVGYMMLYAFFKNLSSAYAEAAEIEGANDITILIKIAVPLAMPIIIPVMVLMVLTTWNDYFTPYLYMPKYPTIAVGLNEISTNIRYVGNYPLLFAIMILSVIPVLLIYIGLQEKMMNITFGGGIKG